MRSWCWRTSTGSSRRRTQDPFQAAVDATQEIGLAVLATTLSLVAIFVPVGFMGGIVGRFMKSFGLTMAFAIMVSLLVSFTLTPMLSARWLKVDHSKKGSHDSKDSRDLPRHRRVLHAHARVVDAPPRAGRRVRGPGAVLERAAVHDRRQELHAERRPVGVRGQPARSGRHQSRGDRGHRQPDRQQHPAVVRSGLHPGDHRRRSLEDAKPRQRLRPADADRSAPARSVRGHGTGAQPDPAATDQEPPHVRTAGRHHRRRRRASGRHPVHHQRTGPAQARSDQPSDWSNGSRPSRASSTSTRR